MQYLLTTTDSCLPYSITSCRQQHQRLPAPWHRLLKWLSAPAQVSGLYGRNYELNSAGRPLGYLHHFQPSRPSTNLNMCWPNSSNTPTNAASMRVAHRTGRRLQQSHPGYPSGSVNGDGNRREQAAERWREPIAATDVTLRQVHDELLLEFDRLRAKYTARGQELAFYRKIVSESTWKEMCCRVQELQDQLGQSSVDFSRISHEYTQLSQYISSLNDNTDRLSQAVLIFTRQHENDTLQKGRRLKEDSGPKSENDEFLPTADPEEAFLRRASRIQRKRARTDLRSQTGDSSTGYPEKSPDDRLMKKQGQPKDDVDVEIPRLKNEFLALQSKLNSAQKHIIHLGGNLGALLPCEKVENVSAKRNNRDQSDTHTVALNLGFQILSWCNPNLDHNLRAASHQQPREVLPGLRMRSKNTGARRGAESFQSSKSRLSYHQQISGSR